MSVKISEIRNEAKHIIKDLFSYLKKSEKKEDWKKAFDFLEGKIVALESGNRGEAMFVWREVRRQLANDF